MDQFRHRLEVLAAQLTSIYSGAILAGGAVRDLYHDEFPKDYDLFFLDKKQHDQAIEKSKEYGLFIVQTNANCYRVKHPMFGDIELIDVSKHCLDANDVLESFDFTVCSALITPKGDFLHHPQFFEDNLAKRIHGTNFPAPYSSIRRLIRFTERGFNPTKATIDKLMELIGEETKELKNYGGLL